MDNQTDDHDTSHPSVGTPEELEEALKWLEELTARQGKAADLSNPVPPTSLDSPFRGLIDNEEGELPDWLREVPKTAEPDNFGEEEPESRLDWLAKMAQRESIEELPTLEWRRLSDPMQKTLAPDHQQRINETIAEEGVPEEGEDAIAIISPVEDESPESPEFAPVEAAIVSDDFAEPAEAVEPAGISEEAAGATSFVEDMSAPVEAAALEDLSESISLPDDEELPSLDDLDAAMAWIEELAASQEAPIEDVPSVADRALASKLMMEAGIAPVVSPLDELGSDSDLMENLTPTHPFIEEEDFADTIVLVETMAADQGITLDMPEVEPLVVEEIRVEEVVTESVIAAEEAPEELITEMPVPEVTAAEMPDELSFEDAMAYLDGLAVVDPMDDSQPVEVVQPVEIGENEPPIEIAFVALSEQDVFRSEDTQDEVLTLPDAETDINEALSIDEAPWKDDVPVLVMTAAVDQEVEDAIGAPNESLAGSVTETMMAGEPEAAEALQIVVDIEETLSELDALALPPGTTLDAIDSALRSADAAPGRDMAAALAWLEAAIARESAPILAPEPPLDEESLIAQMPDDPDAVLAWLEKMAGEELDPVDESRAFREEIIDDDSGERYPAQPILDISEADLMNMPEDPDEAMRWLEGLARGGEPQAIHLVTPDVDSVEIEEGEIESLVGVEMLEEAESLTADVAFDEPAVEALQETPLDPMYDDGMLDDSAQGDKGEDQETNPPLVEPEPPLETKRPGLDWIDLLKPLE